MLLWLGLISIALGVVLFAVDRPAAHFFHARISYRFHRQIRRTTEFAKGAHWLAISLIVFVGANLLVWLGHPDAVLRLASTASLAYLICLGAGTLILHALKIVLGRRRPRDDFEHGLFGFTPFRFDLQYDSFPSGHALTIVCVAVILSGVFPALAPVWFAIALYLALTRALVTAHFLSDVAIGAGIGLLTAREIVLYFFPVLWQPWF